MKLISQLIHSVQKPLDKEGAVCVERVWLNVRVQEMEREHGVGEHAMRNGVWRVCWGGGGEYVSMTA